MVEMMFDGLKEGIKEIRRDVADLSLYNSLFSTFLQYGILVWGLKHETYINPVFLFQKRIVRAMSFQHFTSHSAPIFSTSKS